MMRSASSVHWKCAGSPGRRCPDYRRTVPAALQGPAQIWALVPQARTILHERIAERFKQMMEQGFLAEVRALHERGDLHADQASMRAVGYRQLLQYCAGQSTLDEAVERGIAATPPAGETPAHVAAC